MASNAAQLWLYNLGVTRFSELTPEHWRTVYNYKPQHPWEVTRERLLQELVQMALLQPKICNLK